jgi:hypothetical protein
MCIKEKQILLSTTEVTQREFYCYSGHNPKIPIKPKQDYLPQCSISQTDEEIRASKSLLNPNYRTSEGKKKKVSRKKEKHKHKLQASKHATTLQKTLFFPPSPTTTRDTKESRELKIPLQKENKTKRTQDKKQTPPEKANPPLLQPPPKKKREKKSKRTERKQKNLAEKTHRSYDFVADLEQV